MDQYQSAEDTTRFETQADDFLALLEQGDTVEELLASGHEVDALIRAEILTLSPVVLPATNLIPECLIVDELPSIVQECPF